MEKIEATFRVVTPMFISGTDQRKAELRLPSIKGALRFWWRALAWGRFDNLQKIREEEARLFGSADTGQAAVMMRLYTSPSPLRTDVADVSDQQWKVNTWRHYTGYGLVSSKTRTNPQAREKREYIEAGQRFTLKFSSRSRPHLEKVAESLRLMGLLGGLGARSRNGWGSITLESVIDLPVVEGGNGRTIWSGPSDPRELERELRKFFAAEGEPGDYTALSTSARFTIGKVHHDAASAQETLAETYREFLKGLAGRDKRQREAFGLPRQLRGGRFENADERRASPVFLHIHQFPDEQAVPVVAMLPGRFLPTQDLPAGGWQKAQSLIDEVQA